VSCTGAPPTVTEIERVRVTHSGRRGDVLQLAGGPFAPGALAEPTGAPEIEFEYVGPTFLSVIGTGGPDRLGWGPGGSLNLNGDDDVDVAGSFTVVIVQGGQGSDVIAPRSDYRRSGARLIATGGRGKDTITAPRDGGVVHGGADRDRLRGSPGRDNITGGRGKDVIASGKGRDLIRALDNTRDRVNCGGGFDRVKADGIDRLRNCEKRILVKQRGPVRG
jgi:hypothetical protein